MKAEYERVLSWIGVAALVGIVAFGFLAWQSVTIEQAPPDDALRRFADIRSRLEWTEPLLQVDATGSVTRRTVPAESGTAHPTRLRVLAYRAHERRFVRVDLPFWFFKMKGPAVQYAVAGTGLDLDRLGVSPADLERYGASLVLDETRANGDRLLVWTE